MTAAQESLGPSVGSLLNRAFDAHPPTHERALEESVRRLRDHATEFARLPIARKVELLRDLRRRTSEVADEWVAAACRAKGIPADRPVAGEEWFAGPALILRHTRYA